MHGCPCEFFQDEVLNSNKKNLKTPTYLQQSSQGLIFWTKDNCVDSFLTYPSFKILYFGMLVEKAPSTLALPLTRFFDTHRACGQRGCRANSN
jgi:hypothetical protein